MDHKIAQENLSLVKSVLDRHQIRFWLAWGTCLGAIRERDFIAHDGDIDIEVLSADVEKLTALIPEFSALGFTHGDWWEFQGVKLVRQGIHLDISCAEPIYEDGSIIGWIAGSETLEHDFFSELETVDFLGETYNVPKNPQAYVYHIYGPTWEQPIDYAKPNAIFDKASVTFERRRQHLRQLSNLLQEHDIEFWLDTTTCIDALLAEQGKEQYSWLTIATRYENKAKIMAILPQFEQRGFRPFLTRYSGKYPTTFSCDGDAIAIQYLHAEPEYDSVKPRWILNRSHVFFQDYFSDLDTIDYLGDSYPIPRNLEAVLAKVYGDPFWQLPESLNLGYRARQEFVIQQLQQQGIIKLPVHSHWFLFLRHNHSLIKSGAMVTIKKIEQKLQPAMMVIVRYQHKWGESVMNIKAIEDISSDGRVCLRSDMQGEKDMWLSQENIVGHVVACSLR